MMKKIVFKLSLLLLVVTLSPQSFAQLADTKTKPGTYEEKEAGDYDLTDQERWESQTYYHEGKAVREMNEACEKLKDPNACQGRGKTKFMGIDSEIVKMIAKIYSMFGGMMSMGGGSGMDFKGAKGADGKHGESKKDYCSMIPMAGEMVAMFAQQMETQQLNSQPTSQETPQKELLYRAARSHKAREKSAKIQGTVWTATVACYAGYMAMGGISIDWKVIAKAAGAGFLAFFWNNEAKQQAKYAAEVQAIADQLPGVGDCNPHTQRNCYCTQPETQYDPQYCLPQIHKKAIANNSYAVPCVDANTKVDTTCQCVDTNSCFDQEFFSDLKVPGLVQFAKSSAGKDFRNLTRGELTNGKLAAGTNSNAATRKLLGDLAAKNKENPELSRADLATADAFEKYGLPKSLARLVASQRTTAAGRKKAEGINANFEQSRGNYAKARSSGAKTLTFSGGLGKIGTKTNKRPDYKNMFNKYKKGKGKVSSKTLKFAQKAEQQAQITKNKDKPIFEIISRRYQVSGWRRLEIE